MEVFKDPVVITLSVLGYKLSAKQNAFLNYLVPSVLGTLFYITHLAVDLGCAYSQYREGNAIWGALIVVFLYLPSLGCFLLTVSSWEMWPGDNCSRENVVWFLVKFGEHLFFPAWSMWRCAEKIFWSIEGWLALSEEDRIEALEKVTAPRTIEFYYFLQGFMHTIPQILLQMMLLINYLTDFHQQTNYVAALSIVLNITQMALTTSLYQRFKTQKVGGRDYPWFKPYKFQPYTDTDATSLADAVDTGAVQLRKPRSKRSSSHPSDSARSKRVSRIVYCTRDSLYKTYTKIEMDKLIDRERERSLVMERRRRSSAGYLKPIGADPNATDSDSGAELDEEEVEVFKVEREFSNPYDYSSRSADHVDFPRPIRFVKSIPEDDFIGKLVTFLWWFLFLMARFLSIASFAYFYPKHIIWILVLHFLICVGYLLYDVQTYIVRRTKAVFFLFIGVIYIFCIIEFKKKFKKSAIVYNGFCALVFAENLIMCLVWRNAEQGTLWNEWWYDYVFYVVIGSTVLGVLSMILYNFVNKPEKIVIGTELIQS